VIIELIDKIMFNEILLKKGYNHSGLGRAVGIDESYAAQIANGEKNPGPQVASKICDVLRIPFDDIFYVNHGMLTGTKMGM
jgi:DNA-binding XRE family transcriptional regulator